MTVARGAVAVVIAGVLFAALGGRASEAAPRPSSTIVLNCTSNVTYSYWPTQAPAIAVYYYDSTGVIQDSSDFIWCPNGGGRFRLKLNLTEDWPQISVACFRYTGNDWQGGFDRGYEIGETGFLPRRSSGTCVDDNQSGAPNLGAFASWSVR